MTTTTTAFDPRRALRPSDGVEAYRVLQRWYDHRGGRRDGRLGIPALPTADGGTTPDAVLITPWLHRLRSRFEEAAYREFLAAQAATAPVLLQASEVVSALTAASAEEDELRRRYEALPDEPPAEQLTHRGPAESEDPESVIQMRNIRDWDSRRAGIRADWQAAVTRRVSLATQLDRLRADIQAVFESACLRVLRARAHAERRSHVYLRALIRHHSDRARLEAASTGLTIPTPDWVPQPCPWTAHLIPTA